jgi:hypothetical protein
MAVMPFSPRQIDALRQLTHLWMPERFVLIGAAALGCFLDMRWRGTADLDLALAISLEEFLDERLVPGWRRDRRMEHRWYAPGGEMIDLGMSYEEAGPFLLARTIAAMVDDAERALANRFVREALEEDDPSGIHAKLLALGPPSWRQDPDKLTQCLRAFSRGLR